MTFWRSELSNETVSPKMHMMEDHLVPFVKKWKLGCGFYGEQGDELILSLRFSRIICLKLTKRHKDTHISVLKTF